MKVKKKVDLGAIAFAKCNKLEKRIVELENKLKDIVQYIVYPTAVQQHLLKVDTSLSPKP